MDQNRKVHQFKNPVLNWIEFRLPIISYFKKELNNRWNEIPSRFRAMKAPARVIIDNETSSNYSIIEVNEAESDRPLNVPNCAPFTATISPTYLL